MNEQHQLSLPGFRLEVGEPKNHYQCGCGNTAFFINDECIQCVVCGNRYEDNALPVEEFNALRDELFVEKAGGA